jgi:hypothetical protein
MSSAVRSVLGSAGALVLVIGALLGGCAQQNAPEDDRSGAAPAHRPAATAAASASAAAAPAPSASAGEEEMVVDPTLLAFLSMARAAHHEADLALETNDRARAVQALERVVKAPWSGKKPPEMVEVTADTLARLADLKSEDGKFDDAARDVDMGIAMATEPTHFRGHLFEMRGVVEQRRAKALKDKGDTAGSEKARKAAFEAFDQTMDIQEEVISRMLKEKEKEKDRGGKQAP